MLVLIDAFFDFFGVFLVISLDQRLNVCVKFLNLYIGAIFFIFV